MRFDPCWPFAFRIYMAALKPLLVMFLVTYVGRFPICVMLFAGVCPVFIYMGNFLTIEVTICIWLMASAVILLYIVATTPLKGFAFLVPSVFLTLLLRDWLYPVCCFLRGSLHVPACGCTAVHPRWLLIYFGILWNLSCHPFFLCYSLGFRVLIPFLDRPYSQ